MKMFFSILIFVISFIFVNSNNLGGRVLIMEGFINRMGYFRLHQILLDVAHQSPGPIRWYPRLCSSGTAEMEPERSAGHRHLGAYYLSTVVKSICSPEAKTIIWMDRLLLNPISAFVAHPRHMVTTARIAVRRTEVGAAKSVKCQRQKKEALSSLWHPCCIINATRSAHKAN